MACKAPSASPTSLTSNTSLFSCHIGIILFLKYSEFPLVHLCNLLPPMCHSDCHSSGLCLISHVEELLIILYKVFPPSINLIFLLVYLITLSLLPWSMMALSGQDSCLIGCCYSISSNPTSLSDLW